jgi:hypothetical protein
MFYLPQWDNKTERRKPCVYKDPIFVPKPTVCETPAGQEHNNTDAVRAGPQVNPTAHAALAVEVYFPVTVAKSSVISTPPTTSFCVLSSAARAQSRSLVAAQV